MLVLISSAFCDAREADIGQKLDQDFCKENKVITDPVLQARLSRIGNSIATVASRRDLVYTFRVYEDKDPTACTIPGGYIYATTGLLSSDFSDEEIAGVLSHEIAHHELNQCMKMYDKVKKISKITKILDIFTDDWATPLSAIPLLKNSREDEQKADAMAIELLKKAGFNPVGIIGFFDHTIKQQRKPHQQTIDFLMTHPDINQRYDFFVTNIAQPILDASDEKIPTPAKIKLVVSFSGDKLSGISGLIPMIDKKLKKQSIVQIKEEESADIVAYRLKIIVGEQPKGSLNVSVFTESKSTTDEFSLRNLDFAWVKIDKISDQFRFGLDIDRLISDSVEIMTTDISSGYKGLVVGNSTMSGLRVFWSHKEPKKDLLYDVYDSQSYLKKGTVRFDRDGMIIAIEGSATIGDLIVNALKKSK